MEGDLKDLTREQLSAHILQLRQQLAAADGLQRDTQRVAEQTLQRYRLAVTATNDAVWDWDVATDQVLWNQALEETYGYPLASVDTRSEWWMAQIHPYDRARIEASVTAALEGTQEGWTGEYRFRRADGSYADVFDRGQVIRNERGEVVRMIGAMLDLSRMRTAETALRESEKRFRTILETIEAAFAIVQVKFDADDKPVDYRFVEANPAFEQQAGVNLRGKWVTEFAPDLEQFWFDTYGHVAKTGEPATFENYAEAFKRWFDVRAVSVGERDERQIAIIFSDVTERRNAQERLLVSEAVARENVDRVQLALAERDRATAALQALNDTLELRVNARTSELMQAEEKLRQSQKMEAVGQLTGGLAHDFNNLLAGISGALELMGMRIDQGRWQDVGKYITTAQGAAKRAAALTHRLLAFSRRQTLDPRPTEVNALIDGMRELIQRAVGPSIQLETVGANGLWPALVDASQLENALLNLCLNARDAMPDGGRIRIETANHWMDAATARSHDVPAGQYLSLAVSDTGMGMPADVIAKAFDPFFTTKPIGEGTGLGLSMIYGFAQQSGGQVRISSEVGQGSSVCIFLPRFHGSAAQAEGAARVNPAMAVQTGETILIVDDEPTVRMLLTEVLGELGYTLIEAADSLAGLKVLQSDVQIDLLITDVGLPGGMNGRQMADAGRQLRPGLKTLFITGYAETAVIGDGHLAPGMQVLTKPFAIDTLATRLQELMAP